MEPSLLGVTMLSAKMTPTQMTPTPIMSSEKKR